MQKKFKKRRPFQERENPRALFRKMTRDHVDVLQNIEFTLVQAWREDEAVDDWIVLKALTSSLRQEEPSHPLARAIFQRLAEARALRGDVSDEIWKAGLKVVIESVKTHSDAQPGEVSYLSFVEGFIP